MEEAGLFFYSSESASSILFRLVTKQEFENVGVIIPGTASAPNQAATLNLVTGEATTIGLPELLAKGKVRGVGFRNLAKTNDSRAAHREANLRLQALKLLSPDENKTEETIAMLLGGKTRITERLKKFINELELQPTTGKISIRVLEELNTLLEGDAPLSTYASLFKTWFAGGEIADLITTLVFGKSDNFLPLTYREINSPVSSPGEEQVKLVQALVAKAVTDPDVAIRLSFNHPKERKSGQSPSKITEWASNVVKILTLPELPVIDLSSLLNWTDLRLPNHIMRSCIITTKPAVKLQPSGDIIIDSSGFGLNYLSLKELDELDQKLSQSTSPEDQRLRTLIAQRRAT